MTTKIERYPGTTFSGTPDLPTVAEAAMLDTYARIDPAYWTGTTAIGSFIDAVTPATTYAQFDVQANAFHTTVNGIDVADGNRDGTGSGSRKGYVMPPNFLKNRNGVAALAIFKTRSSDYTIASSPPMRMLNYLKASSATAVMFALVVSANGDVTLTARRASNAETAAVATVAGTPHTWRAMLAEVDFLTGIVTITDLISGATATATLAGSPGVSGAGASDDYGRLFYRDQAANAYYGLMADLALYSDNLSKWQRWAITGHAQRRVALLSV